MHDLMVAWRDLCLLRIGPQDMPYAPPLLGALIGSNVLLSVLAGLVVGSAGTALLGSLVSIAVGLGVLYTLLSMRHIHARFVQAATAIMAAALLFGILSLPVQFFLLTPMPTKLDALTQPQRFGLLIGGSLGLWSLAVAANIYRHALNWRFVGGVLAVVFVNLATLVVLSSLVHKSA